MIFLQEETRMPLHRIIAYFACVCFGCLPALGTISGKIHGEALNVALCTVAYILLTFFIGKDVYAHIGTVTKLSFLTGGLMAALGTIGYYGYLAAFRMAPEAKGEIALIAGSYPMVAILLAFISSQFFGGAKVTVHDWIAFIFFAGALVTLALKPST